MTCITHALQTVVRSPSWKEYVQRQKLPQKALRIVLFVCSILALITPLRLVGSLAGRSAMVLFSSASIASDWHALPYFDRALLCTKLALIALGLVALVLGLPALSLACVAVDTALQMVEMVRAFARGEIARGFIHFVAIIVNIFVLAALATGLWQLLVTAAAISATAYLVGLAITIPLVRKTKDFGTLSPLEKAGFFCDIFTNLALSTMQVVSAALVGPYYSLPQRRDNIRHFEVHNSHSYPILVYDRDSGKVVGTVQPGETADITVDASDSCGYVRADGDTISGYFNYDTELLRPEMDAKYFPMVAIGPLASPLVADNSESDI